MTFLGLTTGAILVSCSTAAFAFVLKRRQIRRQAQMLRESRAFPVYDPGAHWRFCECPPGPCRHDPLDQRKPAHHVDAVVTADNPFGGGAVSSFLVDTSPAFDTSDMQRSYSGGGDFGGAGSSGSWDSGSSYDSGSWSSDSGGGGGGCD